MRECKSRTGLTDGPTAVFDKPRGHEPAFSDEQVPNPHELGPGDSAVIGYPRIVGMRNSLEHEGTPGRPRRTGQY